MDSYRTPARVAAGKLDLDRDRLKAALAAMGDGPVVVTVARQKASRSLQQNAYVWSTVYAFIAEHTGYTVDEVHEWAKCRFLPKAMAFSDGNGTVVDAIVVGGSTTRLDTKQMTQYIEDVRAFARDNLGVIIPNPNESW